METAKIDFSQITGENTKEMIEFFSRLVFEEGEVMAVELKAQFKAIQAVFEDEYFKKKLDDKISRELLILGKEYKINGFEVKEVCKTGYSYVGEAADFYNGRFEEAKSDWESFKKKANKLTEPTKILHEYVNQNNEIAYIELEALPSLKNKPMKPEIHFTKI